MVDRYGRSLQGTTYPEMLEQPEISTTATAGIETEYGEGELWVSCPRCFSDEVTNIFLGEEHRVYCPHCRCMDAIFRHPVTGVLRVESCWSEIDSDLEEETDGPICNRETLR